MILILTQCFPPRIGGIENLVGGLAEAAAATGADVRVFADGAAGLGDGGVVGAHVRRFSGPKPLRRAAKGVAAARLWRQASLVIADSWKSLEWAPSRRPGGPRVLCLAHGMELPAAPAAGKEARIRKAMAKADAVLAASRYTAAACEQFVSAGTALRVVTPPIPAQPEPDGAAQEALQAQLGALGASGERVVAATLCRLEPRKGVDQVLRAVAALKEAHPGLVFLIGGDGDDRARLEALASDLAVTDRVCFLGRLGAAGKAALFSAADVFAMPSRRDGASVEGFGIVYLEAAWYGAPALAGLEGGAADAVRQGETGLLCEGSDADAVRSSLAELLEDPVARHRMAYLCKAHARDQLWERRISDYLEPPASDEAAEAS